MVVIMIAISCKNKSRTFRPTFKRTCQIIIVQHMYFGVVCFLWSLRNIGCTLPIQEGFV